MSFFASAQRLPDDHVPAGADATSLDREEARPVLSRDTHCIALGEAERIDCEASPASSDYESSDPEYEAGGDAESINLFSDLHLRCLIEPMPSPSISDAGDIPCCFEWGARVLWVVLLLLRSTCDAEDKVSRSLLRIADFIEISRRSTHRSGYPTSETSATSDSQKLGSPKARDGAPGADGSPIKRERGG